MMSIEDFDIGDIVRLNCSSTRMTVDKVEAENEEGAISCIWMDEGKNLQQASFHPAQLINVSDRK